MNLPYSIRGAETGYALLHKGGIDEKHIPGKREVKSWKDGCKFIFWEAKTKWHIFHAEHTMTGLEEMSGEYGWKRD